MSHDLDRYLDDFGARLRATKPPRRAPRRIAAAGIALAAISASVALLLPGGSGGGPVNAIAQAREALSPEDSVVYMEVRSSRESEHRMEFWSTPERYRAKATSGDQVFETTDDGTDLTTYDRKRDEVMIIPSADRAKPPFPFTADPAGSMRELLASNEATDHGEHTVDGRRVRRIAVADPAADIVYDVDADTFEPVRMAATVPGEYGGTNTLHVLRYERLPRTPESEKLLTITPGDGARWIFLDDAVRDRHASGLHCRPMKVRGTECRRTPFTQP